MKGKPKKSNLSASSAKGTGGQVLDNFFKNIFERAVIQISLSYLLVFLVVTLFVWLKLTVLSGLSRETPFLFVLFSVFISAYYGGLGPGVLATLLSVLAIIYFFMPPFYSLSIFFRADLEVIVTYIVVGVGVSWLLEQLKLQRLGLEARVKRRTQQLKIANEELKNSNKELQDFAYIASHDLQEPLRKILAFGDRLEQKYGDKMPEEAGDYIQRMVGATERMRLLVEGLLVYARVGARDVQFTRLSLDKVVRSVLSDMELVITDKKANIEIGELDFIDSNELQLRQVFQNLISNALKFHKPGKAPKIFISSQKTANIGDDKKSQAYVKIVVKDEGIGIPKHHQEKIFVIFQRLHGRSEYEGTGIGLAVVRRIVEKHGGKINVVSKENDGTSFEIYLPIKQKTRRYASKN